MFMMKNNSKHIIHIQTDGRTDKYMNNEGTLHFKTMVQPSFPLVTNKKFSFHAGIVINTENIKY